MAGLIYFYYLFIIYFFGLMLQGICHECGNSYLCPGNYTAYQGGSEQRSCSFKIRHWYSSDVSREGCQGLCVINKVVSIMLLLIFVLICFL